jgi:hypothetical protein
VNSIEKLQALERNFTETAPGADASPAELALRTGLQLLGPALRAELPSEPDDLDQLLVRGATFLLSMRSDDGPRLELVTYGEPHELAPAPAPGGEVPEASAD